VFEDPFTFFSVLFGTVALGSTLGESHTLTSATNEIAKRSPTC
jgi:hypothetical protein